MSERTEASAGVATKPHGWAIRTAVPADAPWLSAFAARQFDAAYAADNTPADMADYSVRHFTESEFAALLADPATAIVVSESGREPAAYAVIRSSADPPAAAGAQPAAELARLYVDAAWHGSGLASAMLGEIERIAHRWGASTIWLSVWTRNPRAIRFYRKHGFAIVGSVEFRLGAELQEDHLMTRPVAPPPAE
jgi:diamine N-acetyltransferase